MSTLQQQIDSVKRSIEAAKAYCHELEIGLEKLENPPPFTPTELNYWENHWKNIKVPTYNVGIATDIINNYCTFLTHWCKIGDLIKGNRYYACEKSVIIQQQLSSEKSIYKSFIYTIIKNKPIFIEDDGTKYLLTQSFDKQGHTEFYLTNTQDNNTFEIYLKFEEKD